MRFAFTEDQDLFRDTVRDLLDKSFPAEALRRTWPAEDGTPGDSTDVDAVWGQLAEMGVLALTTPEDLGGMGMTQLDLVQLLVELGRVGYPGPVVDTVAVAVPLIARFAPGDVAAEWLPLLASGEARTVVALAESSGVGSPNASSGDGLTLVAGAADADLVILERGGRVVAIPTTALTIEAQPSVDGARHLAAVTGGESAEIVIAEGSAAAEAIAFARDLGALGTAALLVGLAQQMLDLTVDYAKEREQFGVPIGSFQAMKHHLANALLPLEFAKPVVFNAAYSVAHDLPTASRDVSMAKVYASDAAATVARVALQCHGAIAYTVEYDLHFWMKRTWALVAAWGDAAQHRERVAQTLLDA